MAGTNYTVNYDDERFAEVEAQKQQALTENEQLYAGMMGQSDKFYQEQIQASKDWTEKQQQLQQEQTDFAIEQIEQQKEEALKDHKKEMSGAYVDYQKQINQYGADAEQMAASGMTQTGFSESSKVSMYNTYQNRVAAARESVNKAILSYDNAMTEARLQNNSKMAEIAYQGLQQQLQLALEGFHYNNTLLLDQANKKLEIDNMFHGRYQDVLAQINQENALAEEIRQYNESLKLQQEQMAYEKEQDEKNYQLQLQQLAEEKRQFNASLKASSGIGDIKKDNGTQQVKTKYYSGSIAEDVGGFGYMGKDDNGVAYQPKGVYINGKAYKLSKSGKTAGEMFGKGSTNSSGVNIDKQNVWKANGQYYIWNGTRNCYERVG